MDNPIFEDYLNELHKINPTINDFFIREGWNDKNHIQPNIYSEEYYKNVNDLNRRFLKRLNKIDRLNFFENIFKKDLESYVHLEEDYKIYYYMPINMRDNILLEYVSECSGEGGLTNMIQRKITLIF